jgi:hypothetical protein
LGLDERIGTIPLNGDLAAARCPVNASQNRYTQPTYSMAER